MKEIAAAHPDAAIHGVLAKLNPHRPKTARWLKRHPNGHFHFTPARASWRNHVEIWQVEIRQVEIWFSIRQGHSLKDASFPSVNELGKHINAFIAASNGGATPFASTKSHVYQKHLGLRFADQ